MSETKDLLLEVGTEELPPTALLRLGNAFKDDIEKGLESAKLGFSEVKMYCAPRRLAVLVSALQTQQADENVERRGPAVQAAFDDNGGATKAGPGAGAG